MIKIDRNRVVPDENPAYHEISLDIMDRVYSFHDHEFSLFCYDNFHSYINQTLTNDLCVLVFLRILYHD